MALFGNTREKIQAAMDAPRQAITVALIALAGAVLAIFLALFGGVK